MPHTSKRTFGQSVRIRPEAYTDIRGLASGHGISVSRTISMIVIGWQSLTREQRVDALVRAFKSKSKSKSEIAAKNSPDAVLLRATDRKGGAA